MADDKKGAATEAQDPGEKAFEDFLAELSGDVYRVTIYRLNRTGNQEYCGSIAFVDFDVDTIKDRWGGGRYSCRFHGPKAKGDSGYRGSTTVHIAGPPKDLETNTEPESDLERERRRAEELEDRIRELEGKRIEDRFEELRRDFARAIEQLRTPPPATSDASVVAMALELTKNMQAMFQPHVQANDKDGLLEAVKLGLMLGQGQGGGGDPENPYDGVLNRLGIPALRLLERVLVPGSDPGGVTGLPIDPNPNPNPSEDEKEPPMPTNLEGVIQQWGPVLAGWAQRGVNAEARAEVVADELEEPWRGELEHLLREQQEGALTTLLGWSPELMPHRAWLGRFLAALNTYLAGE